MRIVHLVACVSHKKNQPLPAKELYDSEWFRKARAYVELRNGSWFILSAKHGVLDPDKIIEPYNETLNTMRHADRQKWSKRTLEQLREILAPTDHVVILAGAKYREFVVGELKNLCASVEIPMKHLRIGEQLSWLGRHKNGSATRPREIL
jgi:cytoplasmic iron level regulating protein YaaA (DUF328/UPF0246 family)